VKRALILPLLAGVVLFASCGGDHDESTATSAATATSTAAVETTTSAIATSTTVGDTVEALETDDTLAAVTTDTATAETLDPTVTEATVTESTDVVQSLATDTIDVVVGGSNPARPTFEWTAPSVSPVRYQLVVQAADGTPLWAWTGTATATVLGGVERPANVEGPTLIGPSRVRVYALADDGSFAGVSPWVAIDPAT
jgi:hypothetical protein